MSGSELDDLELEESPLDSTVTALQTGSLEMELGELEEMPLDDVGDLVVPDWCPTLQDIADLVPEFTRGEVDGEGEKSGAERKVFGHDTDPTDQEVEGYIVKAVNHVVGRVGVSLVRLDKFPDLAQTTVAWLVVLLIERKLLTAGAADAEGATQTAEREYVGVLTDLKDQARRVAPRLY